MQMVAFKYNLKQGKNWGKWRLGTGNSKVDSFLPILTPIHAHKGHIRQNIIHEMCRSTLYEHFKVRNMKKI